MVIYGNTEGIKNSILDKMEEVYKFKLPQNNICNYELIEFLSYMTDYLNKEVSVLIDRKGNVSRVSIGDSSTVEIPEIDTRENKLSRVKIIHTHPNGDSRLSSLDISALLKLKLDCIAAIGVKDGKVTTISLGFCNVYNEKLAYETLENLSMDEAVNYNVMNRVEYIENLMNREISVQDDIEKAIIVGIDNKLSLDELEELAEACNVLVVSKVFQNRTVQDPVFYVGKGKIEELSYLAQLNGANVMIFDDELSGSQIRNIEDMLGIKIIDRTTLILDIFARRARSKEAKIQVELAQLKYRLTRLSGLGISLSRTGGGIGTRGPGEKKLETDRRHIRDRIYEMASELKKISKVRKVQRERRRDIPKVSLVGYTNAGKSTLRNSLCEIANLRENINKEKVFEADMLFATLDTTTRALELEDGRAITVTDTVGFIKKLPHQLIEAFKSTLEEVIYSDLLLHVVDVSSNEALEHIEAVNEVLLELGAGDKPILLVLNKIDREVNDNINKINEKYNGSEIVYISAKEKINLELLLKKIGKLIGNKVVEAKFLIPYTDQSTVALIHENSKVKEEEYRYDGTYICALVDKKIYNKLYKFVI
nr:GTPase HflX [Clostridium algifaecis]